MTSAVETRNIVNFVDADSKERVATAQWPQVQSLPRIGEALRLSGRWNDSWFRITDVIWDLREGEFMQRTIAVLIVPCEALA